MTILEKAKELGFPTTMGKSGEILEAGCPYKLRLSTKEEDDLFCSGHNCAECCQREYKDLNVHTENVNAKKLTRSEILETAKRCVCGDREQDYGSPESNFERIAEFWSTYSGYPFTAKDVAAMLALLKIARISSGHAKADNWVDLAGYAACGGEIETEVEADGN